MKRSKPRTRNDMRPNTVDKPRKGAGSEDAAKAKSAFIANISHEIRTPMNAILGFAQMLRNTDLNDKQADYVDVIIDSGKKLLLMISNLLDLSNLQLGRTTLDCKPCRLQDTVERLWLHFEPLIKAKNLNAIIELNADIPIIIADMEKVERVLSFVISNAIKYTDTGFVALKIYHRSISGADILLCFEVADSGIGIEEAKLQHIFDIFEQADNSITRPYGGMGIGLGLSQQIILRLGGTIRVQSAIGEGSRFFIDVPVKLAT